jgi:thioredoxin 1
MPHSCLRHSAQRWHDLCKKGGQRRTPVENMNLTQTNLSVRCVGEANFGSQVLQSRGAVLVAFLAPWSKPCHVIDPVLLEVAQTCAGKVGVVKVNADDNPTLSLRFGVQHIPTLLHFEAGQIRGSLVGTASKEAILKLLFADTATGSRAGAPREGGTV